MAFLGRLGARPARARAVSAGCSGEMPTRERVRLCDGPLSHSGGQCEYWLGVVVGGSCRVCDALLDFARLGKWVVCVARGTGPECVLDLGVCSEERRWYTILSLYLCLCDREMSGGLALSGRGVCF